MKVQIQSYVDRWRFGNKVDDIWQIYMELGEDDGSW